MQQDKTSPLAPMLSTLQRALVGRITAANIPGNLDGLFAYHVAGNELERHIAWDVNCATDTWIAANTSRLGHSHVLAAVGYAFYHFPATPSSELKTTFVQQLARLRQRDPFPEDRVAFAYQPTAFLGLALGTLALGDLGAEYKAWLAGLLADERRGRPPLYQQLLYGYIQFLLTGEVKMIDDLRLYTSVHEVAMLEWTIRRGACRLVDPRSDMSRLQAQVLQHALTTDVQPLDVPRATVLWSAVQSALVCCIEDVVLTRSHVATVLRRFEDALRRWRWDNPSKVRQPIQWPITSEREVQDILWLVLRSVFDDVIDEETLPKFGHSTYKADFAIPSLRLLIEAKFVRKAADFKDYEKEIMEDAIGYLVQASDRYDRIMVFIYDHSSSVQEHGQTIGALRKLPQIEDVIIVSRPSQLPS
jgi:hypothetical protein